MANVPPIPWGMPITDPKTGAASPEFMQWWQQLFGTQNELSDALTEKVPETRQIIAGTGLTGGGDLSQDRTLTADEQAILDQIGTTQGSILYRGASAWAALGPGTNGQVLQTQGAGADPQWVSGAAGSTLLGSAAGTGSSATLTVSSIPATANDLEIFISGRTTFSAGAGGTTYTMTLNSLTTSIYDLQRAYQQSTTGAADQALAQTGWSGFGNVAGSAHTSGMVGSATIWLLDYAGSAWKNIHFIGRQPNHLSSGNAFSLEGTGQIRTTSAITSVSIVLGSGNWTTGSVLRVYGRS